ncbi:MAG: hypothetical protein M1839_001746 [Geoglossum umbratile]|nr:MAG: hypothetical protein M1839_001746 [Geoglossum umbratile]
MGELMSVIDQVGKTVTILSHKEEETEEESDFLEQASSCVGLFSFIQAFTHITYESGAREFGLGRIITTCLLDVLVREYARRMEDLVMEVYNWLRAATRVRKRFDIAVVVLGVVSRLVREQCDLSPEGIWGCLKRQGEEAKPTLEAFGAGALSLIDFDRPPSASFSDYANIVLPVLPGCFEMRIQDTRSLERDSILLGALLLYEAPRFPFSEAMSEASFGSMAQPQTLEEYEAERKASETSPSTGNSGGTYAYVGSTDEGSDEAFNEVWKSFVSDDQNKSIQ